MSHQILLQSLTESAERVIRAAVAATPLPAPEWSPQTILGHLADVDEQVWHARVRLMLAAHRAGEGIPTFVSWEPDAEGTTLRYSACTVLEAAEMFRAARASLVEELSSLTDAEWLAGARHSVWGVVDVAALLEHSLGHDDEHIPD